MRVLYEKHEWAVFLPGMNISVVIVHRCAEWRRSQWPGGVLKIPTVNQFQCRHCWKHAPSEAEAIYHIARMCK